MSTFLKKKKCMNPLLGLRSLVFAPSFFTTEFISTAFRIMKGLGAFSHWQKMSSANATALERNVSRVGAKQIRKAHIASRGYKAERIGERGVAGLKGHKIHCPPPSDYDPRDAIPLSQRMRELPRSVS